MKLSKSGNTTRRSMAAALAGSLASLVAVVAMGACGDVDTNETSVGIASDVQDGAAMADVLDVPLTVTLTPGSAIVCPESAKQPIAVKVSASDPEATVHYRLGINVCFEPTEADPIVATNGTINVFVKARGEVRCLTAKAFKRGLAPSATAYGDYIMAHDCARPPPYSSR